MSTPLSKCVNGCNEFPHYPSRVLCKKCFDALSAKLTKLAKEWKC